MIQRRTQTADYWQNRFSLTSEDVSHIYDQILEEGKPTSIAVLARSLIGRRCQQEERTIQAELNKGPIYQPGEQYEVGQQIIFPIFDYLLGTVVGLRPGRNPGYGDFVVVEVQFQGEEGSREFASGLRGEHKLNRREGEGDPLTAVDLHSVAELYEKHGPSVEEKIFATLSEQDEFVQYRDDWFLRDLLAEIHVVHLNISEALIEIKGMPLPTAEFLSQLDLSSEVPEDVQLLSVNCAFESDERFDNVGDGNRDIWYLRRLTPERVVNPPTQLVIRSESYDRQDIAQELLLIEREIDDEGSGEEVMGPSRPIYRTSITLTYPHWRCGTLPLTVRTRGLFPQATIHHSPVVLVDGQSGDKMQGWVVHEALFVHGMGDWYKRYKLPVGTFVKLERTRDPRVITVDFEPRRLKHLWGKIAAVQGGKLVFQMRKLPIACDYDDQMTIGEDNADAISQLRAEVDDAGESLLQIMFRILPELVKLSPQGTVHAKTIYSAVNILKRVPPGPVFALLSTEPCFVPMGGGYWTFDETLT